MEKIITPDETASAPEEVLTSNKSNVLEGILAKYE